MSSHSHLVDLTSDDEMEVWQSYCHDNHPFDNAPAREEEIEPVGVDITTDIVDMEDYETESDCDEGSFERDEEVVRNYASRFKNTGKRQDTQKLVGTGKQQHDGLQMMPTTIQKQRLSANNEGAKQKTRKQNRQCRKRSTADTPNGSETAFDSVTMRGARKRRRDATSIDDLTEKCVKLQQVKKPGKSLKTLQETEHLMRAKMIPSGKKSALRQKLQQNVKLQELKLNIRDNGKWNGYILKLKKDEEKRRQRAKKKQERLANLSYSKEDIGEPISSTIVSESVSRESYSNSFRRRESSPGQLETGTSSQNQRTSSNNVKYLKDRLAERLLHDDKGLVIKKKRTQSVKTSSAKELLNNTTTWENSVRTQKPSIHVALSKSTFMKPQVDTVDTKEDSVISVNLFRNCGNGETNKKFRQALRPETGKQEAKTREAVASTGHTIGTQMESKESKSEEYAQRMPSSKSDNQVKKATQRVKRMPTLHIRSPPPDISAESLTSETESLVSSHVNKAVKKETQMVDLLDSDSEADERKPKARDPMTTEPPKMKIANFSKKRGCSGNFKEITTEVPLRLEVIHATNNDDPQTDNVDPIKPRDASPRRPEIEEMPVKLAKKEVPNPCRNFIIIDVTGESDSEECFVQTSEPNAKEKGSSKPAASKFESAQECSEFLSRAPEPKKETRSRHPIPNSFCKRRATVNPYRFLDRNYNLELSHEAAEQEQDRLFQETINRLRSKGNIGHTIYNTTHQTGSGFTANHWINSTNAPSETSAPTFTSPLVSVSKSYPDHWKWHNPYARLGLPTNASSVLVRKHYRKLALLYHPDKSKFHDSSARFLAITAAYRRLTF